MSTEMTVSTYQALAPNSRAARAMAANFATGETISFADLTTVSVPTGGITQWQIEDITGSHSVPEIVGICCYYAPYGVLWPSKEPAENGRPLLVTNDLISATKVGDDYGDLDPEAIAACRRDDGSYDWQRLPYNQYGSAGYGRRCKEQRIMAILRQDDTMPILVRVSPGSLKPITQFIRKLPVPFFEAVISLTLQRVKNQGGISYAQIVPRLVETLSEEQGEMIHRLYTQTLGDAVRAAAERAEIPRSDYDIE